MVDIYHLQSFVAQAKKTMKTTIKLSRWSDDIENFLGLLKVQDVTGSTDEPLMISLLICCKRFYYVVYWGLWYPIMNGISKSKPILKLFNQLATLQPHGCWETWAMNIFFLSMSPREAAKFHANIHVVKMIVPWFFVEVVSRVFGEETSSTYLPWSGLKCPGVCLRISNWWAIMPSRHWTRHSMTARLINVLSLLWINIWMLQFFSRGFKAILSGGTHGEIMSRRVTLGSWTPLVPSHVESLKKRNYFIWKMILGKKKPFLRLSRLMTPEGPGSLLPSWFSRRPRWKPPSSFATCTTERGKRPPTARRLTSPRQRIPYKEPSGGWWWMLMCVSLWLMCKNMDWYGTKWNIFTF